MTITAFERALMNAWRPKQLERRRALTSWEDVMAGAVNREVGPALDITFDKLEDFIPVERWRAGNPRLGQSEVVADTYAAKSYFYGTEFHIDSWEQWLRENAPRNNMAIGTGNLTNERFNEQRRTRRLLDEIERQIDNDFYSGNDDISFPGMLNLDSAKTTLVGKVSTDAGRREFVDTLVTLSSTAATDLVRGTTRRLVLGGNVAPWLTLSQDVDRRGDPAINFVRENVDEILVVQNPAMNSKAMLHWVDDENVEIFDQTPDGVVFRSDENRVDGLRVRVFAMWTGHEHRAGTVQVIDGLL